MPIDKDKLDSPTEGLISSSASDASDLSSSSRRQKSQFWGTDDIPSRSDSPGSPTPLSSRTLSISSMISSSSGSIRKGYDHLGRSFKHLVLRRSTSIPLNELIEEKSRNSLDATASLEKDSKDSAEIVTPNLETDEDKIAAYEKDLSRPRFLQITNRSDDDDAEDNSKVKEQMLAWDEKTKKYFIKDEFNLAKRPRVDIDPRTDAAFLESFKDKSYIQHDSEEESVTDSRDSTRTLRVANLTDEEQAELVEQQRLDRLERIEKQRLEEIKRLERQQREEAERIKQQHEEAERAKQQRLQEMQRVKDQEKMRRLEELRAIRDKQRYERSNGQGRYALHTVTNLNRRFSKSPSGHRWLSQKSVTAEDFGHLPLELLSDGIRNNLMQIDSVKLIRAYRDTYRQLEAQIQATFTELSSSGQYFQGSIQAWKKSFDEELGAELDAIRATLDIKEKKFVQALNQNVSTLEKDESLSSVERSARISTLKKTHRISDLLALSDEPKKKKRYLLFKPKAEKRKTFPITTDVLMDIALLRAEAKLIDKDNSLRQRVDSFERFYLQGHSLETCFELLKKIKDQDLGAKFYLEKINVTASKKNINGECLHLINDDRQQPESAFVNIEDKEKVVTIGYLDQHAIGRFKGFKEGEHYRIVPGAKGATVIYPLADKHKHSRLQKKNKHF